MPLRSVSSAARAARARARAARASASALLLLSAARGAAAYAPPPFLTSSSSPSAVRRRGGAFPPAAPAAARRGGVGGGGGGGGGFGFGSGPFPTTAAVVPAAAALGMSSSRTGGAGAGAEAEAGGGGVDDSDSADEFWAGQKALAASMREDAARSLKEEQLEKFARRRLALVNETLFLSVLLFSVLWLLSADPFAPLSYLLGAALGTAYSYGLGKYVETLGGSADDVEEMQGAGVGQARFAFLVLLFVFVGKFRGQGLQEIPSIMGFFTYQLATLSQGLREIYDE